jgi:hypothetical protein
MKKVAIYHGWTKSYSQGAKVPTIKEKPSVPKKELKDCFGGQF